jgi:hypothetical protein
MFWPISVMSEFLNSLAAASVFSADGADRVQGKGVRPARKITWLLKLLGWPRPQRSFATAGSMADINGVAEVQVQSYRRRRQLCNCVHSVLSQELHPGLRGHHLYAYARHVPPFNEPTVGGILPDR